MSLINKMLQDLDARGGDGARASAASAVRPVSYGSRGGLSPAAMGAGLVVLALLGGGAFIAWKYFRGGQQPAPQPLAVRATQAIAQKSGPVAAATGDEGPAVVKGDIPPEAHLAAGEKLARKMEQRNAAARRAAAAPEPEQSVPARPVHRPAAAKVVAAAPAPGAIAPPSAEATDTALNSQQKAENEYRRALAKLQDARVSEAVALLEQAVYLYPRHEAARQTLVSLLIESGRNAEAIRHLVFATNLDRRQVNLAMLLARMQLESGGNALETLQRSLPYAESNAEYRAMVAGVLQRANRHAEAIDHYQAAVRLQPGNGVWWMGMGISLQADKRNLEAKAAFQRAQESGGLSPELQAFVERHLQQLN